MVAKNTALPLYYKIYQSLKDMIDQGIFKPDDCIPSEHELEERFKVSRITIRRAVNELVQEGLLQKRRGLGTFVVDRKYTQQLNYVSGWAETMKEMGMDIQTKSLELDEVTAPAFVAEALNIDATEPVLRIKRLRYSAGHPMCIMVNFIPSHFVPDLINEGFGSEESLYAILENRYNITIARANEMLEARAATILEANELGVSKRSPLLCVKRVTYNENNVPFEVVTVASRGDRYQYFVSLSGRPNR